MAMEMVGKLSVHLKSPPDPGYNLIICSILPARPVFLLFTIHTLVTEINYRGGMDMGGRTRKKKKPLIHSVNWLENDLRQEWVAQWEMKIKTLERINLDVWKIDGDRGVKKLTRVYWAPERLLLLEAFLDHLGRSGFKAIPRWIKTREGSGWITRDGDSFFLSDWPEGNPVKLLDPEQVLPLMTTLARLHYHSRDFKPPTAGIRNNLGQWPHQWQQVRQQLLNWRYPKEESPRETDNDDQVAQEVLDPLIKQITRALNILADSRYDEMITIAQNQPFICNNSFHEASLLVTPRKETYVSDFENCIFDLRVYDLGRFLRRVLYRFKWDHDLGQKGLKAYEAIMPLSPAERRVLLAYLWFPDPALTFIQFYFYAPSSAQKNRLKVGLQQKSCYQWAREQFLNWMEEQI